MNPCVNCGSDVGDENPARPSHCGNCPPTVCEDCGETCYWSESRLCSCWISTSDLGLADLKALFADDCDGPGLSVDLPTGAPDGDPQ